MDLTPDPTDTAPPGAEDRPVLSRDARVLALIPHFACHDWLAGTIESLLAQTRPVDGIVVIDDASQDPPVDIVSAYPDVTLLRAEENVGPYCLVQQVIDATNHDGILFQDADDWSTPDRLERLLDACAATGAELVGSDYMLFDTHRWTARRMLFPLDANAALASHPTGHAQQHPSGLVARTLVDRVGGYATGMRFSGDDEFLRRAVHVAKVVNVPRSLYYRRHRTDSLTTSSTTGHGTPARRAVLAEMSERAHANTAAVRAGRAPDLTPLRSGGPVTVTHLCGPSLDDLNDTSRPRRAGPWPDPGRVRPSARVTVPPPSSTRIIVVGAPGSGADAVAAALGQHPAISYAGDVSWAAAFGAAIVGSTAAGEPTARVLVPGTRPATQLDALALDHAGVAGLLAPTLDTMILGGGLPDERDDGGGEREVLERIARRPLTGQRRWVGTAPPDRDVLVRLLAVFGDAEVVHVVRDVDEVAALGGIDGDLDPAVAADAWLEGVAVTLDLEAALGARVQRLDIADVTADPDRVLDRCLGRLGEDFDPAVSRPFTPATPPAAHAPHPAVSEDARRLSLALTGSPGPGNGLERFASRATAAPSTTTAPPGPVRPIRTRPAPQPSPATPEPPASPPAAPRGPVGERGGPAPTQPVGKSREERTAVRNTARNTVRRRTRVHPSVPSAVELVDRHVPAGATVAVISRGDDALLRFQPTGVHLPSTPDGLYLGHHPADDGAAIAALGDARARGASWLLVPDTSHWWLEHYRGFADHLGANAVEVERAHGHVLFALDGPADAEPVHATRAAVVSAGSARSPGRRAKVHVVSWSVSHNPLGRSHLLAEILARRFDVDIVGATWDRFGGGIWPPLADADLVVRSFPGGALTAMFTEMERVAASLTGDAIVVSKPRLPGYGLAMLAALRQRRPVILDIDDHELAFVGRDTPLTLDDLVRLGDNPALDNPFGGPWTRFCDSLIGDADAVTVSNVTLQERYDGTIIGHGRDERLFDPTRFDRDALRAGFGFDPGERILLFGGTPRRHKGIVDVAAALRRLGDRRIKLCLLDTPELGDLAGDLAEYADHIISVGACSFRELPALVAAADAVCVLQDPDSPVSAYQIPAKITDAMAMCTPCLVRAVPPLQPFIDAGAVIPVTGSLESSLAGLFDGPEARDAAEAGRQLFSAELSYAALAPRLAAVVESQLDTAAPVPPSFLSATAFARRVAAGPAGRHPGAPTGRCRPAAARAAGDVTAPGRSGSPVAVLDRPAPPDALSDQAAGGAPDVPGAYDVVVFWKQNDTGIYDRRHDMILDQLARSPRVRKVVQFDHPIGISRLQALEADGPISQGRLVAASTRARMSHDADSDGVWRRTFVYETRARDDPARVAYPYPAKGDHVDFVTATLTEAGVGQGGVPVVAVGYPKNFDLPDLFDAIGPDLIVIDVVDDHRTWRDDGPGNDEISQHYAELAARADLTLTNCAPMVAEMEALADNVHLVPNGCTWPAPPPAPRPAELDAIDGPIVGYVGNLSARIDIDLLDEIASAHPDWSFVFVGSTHAGREVLALDVHDNVHFLGPRAADDARAFVDAFDVAIIPHVDDPMTRRMHPLKAFVYCTAGVPVVSTRIDNLDELAGLVTIADTPDEFAAAIDTAIAHGRRGHDPHACDVLASHAWSTRMADIERLLDDAWRRR